MDHKLQLYYHRSKRGNFGDDLNPWLWRRLLPRVVDAERPYDGVAGPPLFVGVGTLLNHHLPDTPEKVIFGAGVGYGAVPAPDERWRVYCVRGPHSERALGLPPGTGITDAAVLARTVPLPDVAPTDRVALMPHLDNVDVVDWEGVCERLGLRYINPTSDPIHTLDTLRSSRLVITEAMHGAILADAFGVPWHGVRFSGAFSEFKWRDWMDSLGIAPEGVVTSSPLRTLRRGEVPQPLRRAVNTPLALFAVRRALRRGRFVLSDRGALDTATERLQEQLRRLQADHQAGRLAVP